MTDLLQNINTINENIINVCLQTGRNPQDITVIAASKSVSWQRLAQLKGSIGICGENRVQEFLEKYPHLDCDWHFIGRLQTNKVKYIIDKIKLLHSLDRESLADEIERQCVKNNTDKFDALIEVNIGGESSKGGISPDEAEEFYLYVKKSCPHINVCGLMSVLPIGADEKYYLQMSALYDRINGISGGFKYLSMGMSDDYITAIRYGANMIRLGRALFGERQAHLGG
jgi:pyridoxal phosphate enzyme (YggS family)